MGPLWKEKCTPPFSPAVAWIPDPFHPLVQVLLCSAQPSQLYAWVLEAEDLYSRSIWQVTSIKQFLPSFPQFPYQGKKGERLNLEIPKILCSSNMLWVFKYVLSMCKAFCEVCQWRRLTSMKKQCLHVQSDSKLQQFLNPDFWKRGYIVSMDPNTIAPLNHQGHSSCFP